MSEHDKPTQAMSDDQLRKALSRAWQLGQTYWQQADSPLWTQQAKSDETRQKYLVLVEETCALLATAPTADETTPSGFVPYGWVGKGNYWTQMEGQAAKLHPMTLVYVPNGAQPSEAQTAERAMTDAARDVLAERERQVTVEGWVHGHDDEHDSGEMASAAACYALSASDWSGALFEKFWPPHWSRNWWKPTNPRRDLVKAAALILAEIERIDRRGPK